MIQAVLLVGLMGVMQVRCLVTGRSDVTVLRYSSGRGGPVVLVVILAQVVALTLVKSKRFQI